MPGDKATIFLAVLEELYREGVGNDDVDVFLLQDATTSGYVNFVYGCPLCLPAIDALRLYRGRPTFYGLKGEPDTFGDGLPAREREALRSGDVQDRLGVVQAFMQRAMQRKLASMRLTSEEHRAWQLALHEMREKGSMMLKGAQQAGAAGVLRDATGCAVCDGMDAAGSWMDR
ncbi:MAG: hypothetical protein JNK15_25210 [Planctomycetes bacterium]|nr:hypothetical protein [Planctomycetota bacterium]